MTRTLTGATLTEIQATAKRPVIFFEMDLLGGAQVFMWSGLGSIVWNGQTWLGVGNLGAVANIVESTDTIAQGVQVSLSGVPSALIADALAQVQRGLAGKLYLGFMDANGNIVVDPVLAFSGRLDQPEIDKDPSTPVINITYANRLAALERPLERRLDSQDQQIDYPGDKGFDFVPSIQQWNGKWGSS